MIGLMWYLMGMGTTGFIYLAYQLHKKHDLDIWSYLNLLTTFGLAWICIGWSWASFAEGEPQSGAMGLVCFGLPTLIFGSLSWRRIANQ